MAPPQDHAETVGEPLDPWRVRVLAAIVFTIVALVATARADSREALAAQLDGETAAIARAAGLVDGKLAEADGVRARRLAAAYRVLHAPPADDRMATARRRAAARLLIERDVAERALLADERAQLRAAATRTAADSARVAGVALPATIKRPARGAIARRFGTLQHDRSKATLARRGLDFEVESRALAVAPADGTVRYAGPIRGLDGGVIIDHGGYYTVVAKLGELAVPVGAPVVRGDRIGRAARYRVYLEVRVKLGAGGRPIDPEPLLEPGDERRPKR